MDDEVVEVMFVIVIVVDVYLGYFFVIVLMICYWFDVCGFGLEVIMCNVGDCVVLCFFGWYLYFCFGDMLMGLWEL